MLPLGAQSLPSTEYRVPSKSPSTFCKFFFVVLCVLLFRVLTSEMTLGQPVEA